MKVLTLNFLTCAVKACKSSADSFPLHPKDAELVQDDIDINSQLILNVLPRIDWTALKTTSTEVRRAWHLSHPPTPVPSLYGLKTAQRILTSLTAWLPRPAGAAPHGRGAGGQRDAPEGPAQAPPGDADFRGQARVRKLRP